MRISIDNLKLIVKKLDNFLFNKRIISITQVNSRLFLFTLKNCEDMLLVDLDNLSPHIGLIKTNYDELSLPSEFIARAMNKGTPCIKKVELMNNDKVVRITTTSMDAYYHQNKYYLYIELIVSHANMILMDEHHKIIVGFYETNLMSPHLIIKGYTYKLPINKLDNYKNEDFSLKKYDEYVLEAFNDALNKRKKEIYGPYLKKYEKLVKSLNNKLNKIKDSEKSAHETLKYKEIGETLLMNINEIKKGATSFNNIKLNPMLDVVGNANYYFAKYKKAKRGLLMNKTILEQTKKELEDANYYLEALKCAKEDEIKLLMNINNTKKKADNARAYLPYYISYQNTIYYFGHNALENDYLTFKMFKKGSEVIWLHLKDQPSSHMIINKINPSNKELDLACSILLLQNKLTTGEIMYAKRSDITRGDALAKVNVLKYKSIMLRKINPIATKLLKEEKRVHE